MDCALHSDICLLGYTDILRIISYISTILGLRFCCQPSNQLHAVAVAVTAAFDSTVIILVIKKSLILSDTVGITN